MLDNLHKFLASILGHCFEKLSLFVLVEGGDAGELIEKTLQDRFCGNSEELVFCIFIIREIIGKKEGSHFSHFLERLCSIPKVNYYRNQLVFVSDFYPTIFNGKKAANADTIETADKLLAHPRFSMKGSSLAAISPSGIVFR